MAFVPTLRCSLAMPCSFSREGAPVAEGASHLERMHFMTSGPRERFTCITYMWFCSPCCARFAHYVCFVVAAPEPHSFGVDTTPSAVASKVGRWRCRHCRCCAAADALQERQHGAVQGPGAVPLQASAGSTVQYTTLHACARACCLHTPTDLAGPVLTRHCPGATAPTTV